MFKGYKSRFSSYIPHLARYYQNLDKLFINDVNILVSAAKKDTSTLEIIQSKLSSSQQTKGDDSMMDKINLPNAKMGEVVTRFPPEPSGYLHIGHAKAAQLNYFIAKKYKGKLIIRFDDTNPAKEKEEYKEAIIHDLKTLGVVGDIITHSSDSFDLMMDYAVQLLKNGKAYVDNESREDMKTKKKTGQPSRDRERPIEESLKLWEEMVKGTELGFTCCVRAKLDYKNTNLTLRDPVLFRCKNEVHPKLGDKYKAYPT
jgi:glutamyl/glutaminyl-tRNA synthetase